MEAKTFEIRDVGTFIPVLAVKLTPANEADRYLIASAGYGITIENQSSYVVMWALDGGEAKYSPYDWSNRTRLIAHEYINEHFDELESGAVIDVEFILGITGEPKHSERQGFLSAFG